MKRRLTQTWIGRLAVCVLGLFWFSLAWGVILPSKEGYDRLAYAGISLGLLGPADARRHATSPVGSFSLFWGSDWSRQLGFNGEFYNYNFKEDMTKRPLYYLTHGGSQTTIYQHVGIRLRGMLYFTENRLLRFRPIFSSFTEFIPYLLAGVSLEPTVRIRDYNYDGSFDTVYFGMGITEGVGVLQVFRGTRLRLRYELALVHSFNPTSQGGLGGAFTEPSFSVGLEYAFLADQNVKPVEVSILDGHQIQDPSQLDRMMNGGGGGDVFSLINGGQGGNLNERKTTLLFYNKGESRLRNSSYYNLHSFDSSMKPSPIEDERVIITGYSPDTGDREEDLSLARERTADVRAYFIRRGLSPDLISYNWYVLKDSDIENNPLLAKAAKSKEAGQNPASVVVVSKILANKVPILQLKGKAPAKDSGKKRKLGDPIKANQGSSKEGSGGQINEFEREKRRLLLVQSHMRLPDDHESSLLIQKPASRLIGNQKKRSTAYDTRIKQTYNAEPDSKIGKELQAPDSNRLVPLNDQEVGKKISPPAGLWASPKSYQELLEEKGEKNGSLPQSSRAISPNDSSSLTRARLSGVWFEPFGKNAVHLNSEQMKRFEKIASNIKADSDPRDRVLIVGLYPGPKPTSRALSKMASRQVEVMNVLIKQGAPPWRLIDNTYYLGLKKDYFQRQKASDSERLAFVKGLVGARLSSIDRLKGGPGLMVVVVKKTPKAEGELQNQGAFIDIAP